MTTGLVLPGTAGAITEAEWAERAGPGFSGITDCGCSRSGPRRFRAEPLATGSFQLTLAT